MKKILGLDLGSNSIGWAVISTEENTDNQMIAGVGSRIIPMDAAILGDFDKGNSTSQTKERTDFRGIRRLKERVLLRRERLHRVLNILGFLPNHYATQIDFERHFGQFKNHKEPKIAWNEYEPKRFEFIFKESFDEMLSDFKRNHPSLFELNPDSKIPYDWTLYYLRTKALTQKITKEELAWILLNFNQKRGYYQLRGEDEQEVKSSKTRKYFISQKVVSITDSGETYKGLKILLVELEDGSIGKIFKKDIPQWVGKEMSIFATVDIDKDGNDRVDEKGSVSQRFSIPTESEWETEWSLIKLKTEEDLKKSRKTVGQYIYDALLNNPDQKIRGRLVRVIERKYYKDELKQIIDSQRKFHAELESPQLYSACINDLYRCNQAYRNSISGRDFAYLFIDDILFYQRPLKSKKSLIANCKYESNTYIKDGVCCQEPLKVIPKSHPLYQEFRLWKFISQLTLFKEDRDVTNELIKSESDYIALYEWLNAKKEVQSKELFKWEHFGIPKKEQSLYRWNYVIEGDKKYPCNETLSRINHRLVKQELSPISDELLPQLWHILYSVTDTEQIKRALTRFARKNGYDADKFVLALKSCVFESDYGAYSEKAIKKFLSLMRRGIYWNQEQIDSQTKRRIEKVINGEFEEQIDERSRKIIAKLHGNAISDFHGLDEVTASYVIYGRHSESKDCAKWSTPDDIDRYLREFRQHSLNNPIVEQIIMETLRTVRDIWKKHGTIDEIHIELGREMKKTKLQREQDSKRINENENTNIRIKRLLSEFQNERYHIDNVRPHSLSQQDILRIYEDTIVSSCSELPEEIKVIRKKFNETDNSKQPTSADVLRYKLWLEQQYRSPYTGAVIPLGRLFTHEYEIEHVVPQSRFFDNSFSNKVICEAEVNSLKSNQLGLEFIKNHRGEKVMLSRGGVVTIFDEQSYAEHVKKYYENNKAKRDNLLLDEIPDKFINRQLNDTRYISRFVSGLLSNIVRESDETEVNSKNLIVCSGGVTTSLKKDWGLNDVWNRIVTPRFERLNEKTQSTMFGSYVDNGGKRYFQTQMPIELAKGFNKKRIDHRHHAMDAIVIACATRSHISYLNNQSAKDEKGRYDLRHKLCFKDKYDENGNYTWRFHKPWNSFTQDVYKALEGIAVSFKQNLRVINKASNTYTKFNAEGKKESFTQDGTNWAIRKSMHRATVFGQVNLRGKKSVRISEALGTPLMIVDGELKSTIKSLIAQGLSPTLILKEMRDKQITHADIYYFSNETNCKMVATRKSIDSTFDVKKIEAVTDTGVRKILLAHLAECGNNSEVAFSAEGIEMMNKNILVLNKGKAHKPIYTVRWSTPTGNKFPVGNNGCRNSKFVVADEGTNLFFAVYEDKNGNRSYDSIPLNIVIERQKQGLGSAPDKNDNGDSLQFTLSPNDLVYVPTPEQIDSRLIVADMDNSRIYRFTDGSGTTANFIPHHCSNVILSISKTDAEKKRLNFNGIQDEYGLGSPQSKNQRAITGEMIKEICVPIIVDRLGNISIKQ